MVGAIIINTNYGVLVKALEIILVLSGEIKRALSYRVWIQVVSVYLRVAIDIMNAFNYNDICEGKAGGGSKCAEQRTIFHSARGVGRDGGAPGGHREAGGQAGRHKGQGEIALLRRSHGALLLGVTMAA